MNISRKTHRHFYLIFIPTSRFRSRSMHPSPSQRATARQQFIRYIHLSAPARRQDVSSPSQVDNICGVCRDALSPQECIVLPCNHVFHHFCVEDVLRYARYLASSGCVTIDCMMCGTPAAVSLLPAFGNVDESRQLPRQLRAVRAEDGVNIGDDDGPLEPWHRFARRQDVRGGSAILLALQEDVARVSYPAFIPHRQWGDWVRTLRLMTVTELQHQFDTSAETTCILGRWALRVNNAIEHEDSAVIVGNLPTFPLPPAGNSSIL